MSEGILRSLRVLAIIVVAAGILVLVEFFFRMIGNSGIGEGRSRLVSEWVGTDTIGAAQQRPNGIVLVPFQGDDQTRGVVVFVPMIGYQSMVESAIRFDYPKSEPELRVYRSEETPPLNRRLIVDGPEAITGATITINAIEHAKTIARRQATEFFTESR